MLWFADIARDVDAGKAHVINDSKTPSGRVHVGALRGVILHDAGIGRHSSGISGVLWLGGLGIAACAVDYRSACIGDSQDVLAHGVISTVNEPAAEHGCLPGHTARQADPPAALR